mmetsp:Transcript_7721/g.18050  ORF Transcript_7721/g.18050 Transcript_7721/m.18050 type:complete len:256 (-) Transcript_7721:13-780(-)
MQAGTTGINAMRVYNVTKQGKDQDADGAFIRKHVPELRSVPTEYIHEPWTLSPGLQHKYQVTVGDGNRKPKGIHGMFEQAPSPDDCAGAKNFPRYPLPIVDEKASAKEAKDKVSAVRKQESTKIEAQQVFLRHGSRSRRDHQTNSDRTEPRAAPAKRSLDKNQTSLSKFAVASPAKKTKTAVQEQKGVVDLTGLENSAKSSSMSAPSSTIKGSITSFLVDVQRSDDLKGFNCRVCTYYNEKPYGLACSMCGSTRE